MNWDALNPKFTYFTVSNHDLGAFAAFDFYRNTPNMLVFSAGGYGHVILKFIRDANGLFFCFGFRFGSIRGSANRYIFELICGLIYSALIVPKSANRHINRIEANRKPRNQSNSLRPFKCNNWANRFLNRWRLYVLETFQESSNRFLFIFNDNFKVKLAFL